MLTNPFVRQNVTIVDPLADIAAINRLLAAAVTSKSFRSFLLGSPRDAVEAGFAGETFELSAGSLNFLASIKVGSLREFAEQIHDQLPAHLAAVM
jgi:hypothetical protein